MEQSWLDSTRGGRLKHTVTDPIFTDPSGRRRRLMLMVGAGASVLCVVALIMVGTGLVGGSNAPFALWGAPHSPAGGRPGATIARHDHHGHQGGPQQPGPTGQPGTTRSSSPATTPSPKTDRSPSPTPSPSPSPSRRHGRSKSPNPHSKSPRSHTPTPHGRQPADVW